MKVKLFIFSLVMLSCSSLFSQNTVKTDGWKLLSSDKNVSVYYEEGTCRNANVMFIKIVNKNNQAATVSWSMWDSQASRKLEVKANETVTGECANRLPMATLTEVIPAGKTEKDLHAAVTVQLSK
jgi:hypothetical protein